MPFSDMLAQGMQELDVQDVALTDDVLVHIFRLLSAEFGPEVQEVAPREAGKQFVWFRRCLPLVCKRWSALLGRGGKHVWTSVVVSVEQEVSSPRRLRITPKQVIFSPRAYRRRKRL